MSWLVGLVVTSPLYFWLASRDSARLLRSLLVLLALLALPPLLAGLPIPEK